MQMANEIDHPWLVHEWNKQASDTNKNDVLKSNFFLKRQSIK